VFLCGEGKTCKLLCFHRFRLGNLDNRQESATILVLSAFLMAPNEVPIALDSIEQALLQFAYPGNYGSVRIRLKVLKTAAEEILLTTEHRTVTRLDVATSEQKIIASNERFNRVRASIAEKARELRLTCPVSEIIAHFQDGRMASLELVKNGERLV
jgi:hypothetical protein